MNPITFSPISFRATPKESESITRACKLLKNKINGRERIEIPIDTADFGEKFYLSSEPTKRGVVIKGKLINEENKSYASQIIAINNPEDIAKYTRQKEFNKQVEKIFDRLKSVITKIENSYGE